MRRSLRTLIIALPIVAVIVAGCASSAPPVPTARPTATAPPAAIPVGTNAPVPAAPTAAPASTNAPASAASGAAPTARLTAAPQDATRNSTAPTAAGAELDARTITFERPEALKTGDTGLVRLTFDPKTDMLQATVEIAGNQVETRTAVVLRPPGYSVSALARLDGLGFEIDPSGEWRKDLPADAPVSWLWTLRARERGRHTLVVNLSVSWTPEPGSNLPARDRVQVFSRAAEVLVSDPERDTSPWVLLLLAALGLLLALLLLVLLLRRRGRPASMRLLTVRPNEALAIETQAGIQLDPARAALIRAAFAPYQRVVIEREFRSGYSGARAFLVVPIKPDGRADAHTIVKIGDSAAIVREYDNYLRFVKDTLPPITARIQEAPVAAGAGDRLAALRYTFIGGAAQRPISLREALIERPDPALLRQLFDTFGPTWWMQRHARTFTCAQEYDRVLPAHLVTAPASSAEPGAVVRGLDGRQSLPADLQRGQHVRVEHFARVDRRADGESWSLSGAGQPPARIRVLSGPNAATPAQPGQQVVIATRMDLLREAAGQGDRYGLPDPLALLPTLLDRTVRGSQSIIHGDLNLENALVGPGGAVWLIDFAETREGHPLMDFAHLYADLIAHVVAPQMRDEHATLDAIARHAGPPWLALLQTVDGMAGRCLYDPADLSEWALAKGMACLGALKFANLGAAQKRLLYLVAALSWRELA